MDLRIALYKVALCQATDLSSRFFKKMTLFRLSLSGSTSNVATTLPKIPQPTAWVLAILSGEFWKWYRPCNLGHFEVVVQKRTFPSPDSDSLKVLFPRLVSQDFKGIKPRTVSFKV